MTNPEKFNANGCVLVKELFDQKLISLISRYLENKIRRGEWKPAPAHEYRSSRFGYYADPLLEVLLQDTQKQIEEVTGLELLPTYSFARVYQPGEQLKGHFDRPSCEVSVTVNVASKGEPSPFYTQYKENPSEKHLLAPGDAVVYKGCDVGHWRLPLEDGQLNIQFMLHYVNKNGANAKHEKDGRLAYGFRGTVRSQ